MSVKVVFFACNTRNGHFHCICSHRKLDLRLTRHTILLSLVCSSSVKLRLPKYFIKSYPFFASKSYFTSFDLRFIVFRDVLPIDVAWCDLRIQGEPTCFMHILARKTRTCTFCICILFSITILVSL